MSKRKKTLIGSDHRKNFSKFLDFAARSHGGWKVFEDFLTIAAISISNSADPNGIVTSKETIAEREKRYLSTINNYSKSEQKFLVSMFAELVLELESNFTGNRLPHLVDVLGELFHELNFNDHWKGQFFTPQHICDLTGKLVIGDNEKIQKEISERGYFTVYEPCCGGGAMIYGAVNSMFEIGLNPNKNVLVVAGDIDERCVFMTYIQCSLYGIPAVIRQKNALKDEFLGEVWFTPLYILNKWRWNRSVNCNGDEKKNYVSRQV